MAAATFPAMFAKEGMGGGAEPPPPSPSAPPLPAMAEARRNGVVGLCPRFSQLGNGWLQQKGHQLPLIAAQGAHTGPQQAKPGTKGWRVLPAHVGEGEREHPWSSHPLTRGEEVVGCRRAWACLMEVRVCLRGPMRMRMHARACTRTRAPLATLMCACMCV